MKASKFVISTVAALTAATAIGFSYAQTITPPRSDVTTPSQPAPFTQNSQTAPRSGSPGAVDRANTIPINPRAPTQSDATLPNQPAPFNTESGTTSRSPAARPTNASGVQSGAPAPNDMSSMASVRVAREDRN